MTGRSMTLAEFRAEQAKTMTEDQLLAQVLGIAKLYGWRTAHFRPAQTRSGRWVTAVQGDGKGYPDLTLAHGPAGRLVFAELKTARGKVTPEQADWLHALELVAEAALDVPGASRPGRPYGSVEVYTWRPADLLDGIVEAALSVSTAHRAAALH